MITTIIAILGGLIAASSLIIAKKPDAQELLDKLTPFQGGIGVVLTFWGVRGLAYSLMSMKHMGLTWLTSTAMSACMLIVGFLLAYSLISKYLLENNESAKEKGQQIRSKLINYQVPAGVVLVVLGAISLIRML